MSPLFDPSRHEPLTPTSWDEPRVRACVEAIARDAFAASRDGCWPVHPLEDGAEEADGTRLTTLYTGAAGVLLGLHWLAAAGAAPGDARLVAWARELPERYLAEPDTGQVVPSYLVGEAGVRLASLVVGGRSDAVEHLAALALHNAENPTRELLWGSPGTMIATVRADAHAPDRRLREAYLEAARLLMDAWDAEGYARPWLQDLYGERRHLLGAGHGFAGNVHALLAGSHWLPPAALEDVARRARRTLLDTAIRRATRANWPTSLENERLLVQWCHGAPGVVTSLSRAPADPELDALLREAGELVFAAGPLAKGPSLCHGTAGNGAALLTLFARTGDDAWLERARRFAMHAIEQVEGARKRYGRGRHSLWTGDVGVAIYLWQCIQGTAGLPSLDF